MKVAKAKKTGRPPQHESEALIAKILNVASRLFREQGYAGTSIEQIASVAGSGKQTIYRRFSTKELLFQAVMGARVLKVRERVSRTTIQDDPVQSLRNVTHEMFEHMLNPESIAFHRILVAEAPRFPELVKHTFDRTVGPFITLTQSLLRAATASGQLRLAHPEVSAGHLMGLISGWPHQQALLGNNVLSNPALRTQFFDAAWALFISGAGTTRAGSARKAKTAFNSKVVTVT